MTRTIRISNELYSYIQRDAIPLEDTPNSVLLRWADDLGLIPNGEDIEEPIEDSKGKLMNPNLKSPPTVNIGRGRNSGPNLFKIMLRQFEEFETNSEVRTLEKRVIMVGSVKLYCLYANLNKSNNYYFGFNPETLRSHNDCHETILLCADGQTIRVFAMPYKEFLQLVTTGSSVGGSEQYQSHIFPDKDFQLTVTGNTAIKIDMRQYQVYHGNLAANFVESIVNDRRI